MESEDELLPTTLSLFNIQATDQVTVVDLNDDQVTSVETTFMVMLRFVDSIMYEEWSNQIEQRCWQCRNGNKPMESSVFSASILRQNQHYQDGLL